jgi:L-2-hydroxyglutarate oxidase LhgO
MSTLPSGPLTVHVAVLLQAGVVGLACARAAAQAGLEVVLLEQEASYGTATSSRHSEVIHAGIYYPAGKLLLVSPVRV